MLGTGVNDWVLFTESIGLNGWKYLGEFEILNDGDHFNIDVNITSIAKLILTAKTTSGLKSPQIQFNHEITGTNYSYATQASASAINSNHIVINRFSSPTSYTIYNTFIDKMFNKEGWAIKSSSWNVQDSSSVLSSGTDLGNETSANWIGGDVNITNINIESFSPGLFKSGTKLRLWTQ